MTLVCLSVLVGALLELAPPLLLRNIVDEQLVLGRSQGLLLLAALFLAATAAVKVMVFATEYLTASVAQRVLRSVRVQLFAHLQRLPMSYYDQTPLGDTISRCTADVEAVSTLFSTVSAGGGGGGGTSGSTMLMGVVRLITIGIAMVVLSPLLSLVAALTVVPVVVVTRFFQIRVRAAERTNRRAVGMQNTHLQEALGGVEVIRSLASEGAFVARFRVALRDGLAACNRATIYSAIYTPLMIILAGLAMALVLWAGSFRAGAAIVVGHFHRHHHRFYSAVSAVFRTDRVPGQRVADRASRPLRIGTHLPGVGPPGRGDSASESAICGRPKKTLHRDAGGVIRLSDRKAHTARRSSGGAAGRNAGAGGADRGWIEQFATSAWRSLHPLERVRSYRRRGPEQSDRGRPAPVDWGCASSGATFQRNRVRQPDPRR